MRTLLAFLLIVLFVSGGPIDTKDFEEETKKLLEEIDEESGNVDKTAEDTGDLSLLEGDMGNSLRSSSPTVPSSCA